MAFAPSQAVSPFKPVAELMVPDWFAVLELCWMMGIFRNVSKLMKQEKRYHLFYFLCLHDPKFDAYISQNAT